jgi:hypothetical protein
VTALEKEIVLIDAEKVVGADLAHFTLWLLMLFLL